MINDVQGTPLAPVVNQVAREILGGSSPPSAPAPGGGIIFDTSAPPAGAPAQAPAAAAVSAPAPAPAAVVTAPVTGRTVPVFATNNGASAVGGRRLLRA